MGLFDLFKEGIQDIKVGNNKAQEADVSKIMVGNDTLVSGSKAETEKYREGSNQVLKGFGKMIVGAAVALNPVSWAIAATTDFFDKKEVAPSLPQGTLNAIINAPTPVISAQESQQSYNNAVASHNAMMNAVQPERTPSKTEMAQMVSHLMQGDLAYMNHKGAQVHEGDHKHAQAGQGQGQSQQPQRSGGIV